MRRWTRWRTPLLALLAALAVVALLLALTPQGRTLLKTALLVPQLVPAIPVKPQESLGPEVVRQEVRFDAGDVERVGDLYAIPDGQRRAAVVLFLGVNPAGRDDPRVVNLSEALARAGMVVLVPWSESMVERRIEPQDADRLVHAFQYLQARPNVDPQRVGLGGFCVGASFSLVAAADPRIADQVAFVNFFGGYHDGSDLLAQIASRTSYYRGERHPWEPGDLTREVFTQHLLESVPDAEERRLLEERLASGQPIGNPDDLSPEAQVVARLLSGPTLEEAQELVSQLPAQARQRLETVSPSTVVEGVRARVLIMHGRGDDLVPVEESRRLRDALQRRDVPMYYTEFVLFQHMDPTRPVDLLTFAREAWKLYWHLYQVVRVAS